MGLTPAEREVLRLRSEGLPREWIAAIRGCSPHTVKALLGRVRIKLNSQTTAHSVALAYRQGWL